MDRGSTVSKLTEANFGQARGKHGDALWVILKSNKQAACRRKERRDDRKPQRQGMETVMLFLGTYRAGIPRWKRAEKTGQRNKRSS